MKHTCILLRQQLTFHVGYLATVISYSPYKVIGTEEQLHNDITVNAMSCDIIEPTGSIVDDDNGFGGQMVQLSCLTILIAWS